MKETFLKKVFSYIDSKYEESANLTSRLVSIATVNPPGKDYKKIVQVLECRCRMLGLSVKRIDVPKEYLLRFGIDPAYPRINLIADWNTGSKKTLHITAHYDVVPVTSFWKSDPFVPVTRKGRIYGRGTGDMKGAIVSMLLAVDALMRFGYKPSVNIQLSFCPDEETGGYTGFGWLVQNGLVRADFGLSEGYPDEYVSCGSKGVLWMIIEVRGKSAHGSIPYDGVNSFEYAVKLVNELERLKSKVQKRKTSFFTKGPKDKYASLMIGGELIGGNKINMVPDRTVFSIDRRVLPEEEMLEAYSEIVSVIEGFKKRYSNVGIDVNISKKAESPPLFVRDGGVLFDAVSGAIKDVIGKRCRFAIMPGSTDIRYLLERGIPAIGYSPGDTAHWHSDNEYIEIKSILTAAKVYASTIFYLR